MSFDDPDGEAMAERHAETSSEFTAVDALAVLTKQQWVMAQRRGHNVWLISGVWGVAWIVGFTTVWLTSGADPNLVLSGLSAWTTLVVVFVIAAVLSAVLGIRTARGIRSNTASAFAGGVFGATWIVGILAIALLGLGLLAHGMTQATAGLYFASAYALLVGVMHLAAAAIWRRVQAIVAGCLLIVFAAVAPFFGDPANYLVIGLGGGAVFIALAVSSFARSRTDYGAVARA